MVASPINLKEVGPMIRAMMSVLTIQLFEYTRRVYAHPQNRLVWRIGKVRVPILLKLRAELSQLGRRGAPLDSRVDRAFHMDMLK
jgi:hypothetical protein